RTQELISSARCSRSLYSSQTTTPHPHKHTQATQSHPTSTPAANTGQTPKHQEPRHPKDSSTNQTPHKMENPINTQPKGTEACCLKTQQHAKPYKPHNTHTPLSNTQEAKDPSNAYSQMRKHHAATASTPHTHAPHTEGQVKRARLTVLSSLIFN